MKPLRSWMRQLQQGCTNWGKSLHQSASTRSVRRVILLRKRLRPTQDIPKAIVLVIVAAFLTGALGGRFYNQPKLSVGRVAPETIAAPTDARVEDKQATEEKRKNARSGSVSMLMLNADVNEQNRQAVQNWLTKGTALRQQAGSIPFADRAIISEPTQRYLRKAEDWEWKAILSVLQDRSANFEARLNQLADPTQRKAAIELQRSKNQPLSGGVSGLATRVNAARQLYNDALSTMQSPTEPLTRVYDVSIFEILDAIWQKTQTEIVQVADRILAQGIPPGLPPAQLETAINLNLQLATPPETRAIAARLLLASLKPNLVKDEEQTRLQAEKAAQSVQPEFVSVQRGDAIAIAGQSITARQFILLDYFNLSRRETNWFALIGFGGLVSGAVVLFWQIEQRFHVKGLRNRDYWLVSLMAMSTPLLILIGAPSTNLAAIGFLMGTFYESMLALASVGLLAMLLPIGMSIGVTQWLPSAAAGLLVAVLAERVRSREELALLGLGVGLVQGAIYLMVGALSGLGWYGLLWRSLLEALLGLAWSIVAIGISPYIEHVFDVVTTLRLVELANPNRPLLKRLAAETPGTFQHTLFVANLAEAAARELGCNVELVRAGTLYHDIGKMHDPLGFIENQMGGLNKHDAIDDPWISAAIIKKHVTEGIAMARRARLPKAVQAFIPEHQGTMTISYFHHQAKQRAQADSSIVVQDADFCYDGPAPQSRETAIVMLADSCEAALRSLKDATPEEALNMINKILAARWKDGQLEDSGLTRREITQIAKVFVQVWQQSNHQRIVYPKAASK